MNSPHHACIPTSRGKWNRKRELWKNLTVEEFNFLPPPYQPWIIAEIVVYYLSIKRYAYIRVTFRTRLDDYSKKKSKELNIVLYGVWLKANGHTHVICVFAWTLFVLEEDRFPANAIPASCVNFWKWWKHENAPLILCVEEDENPASIPWTFYK